MNLLTNEFGKLIIWMLDNKKYEKKISAFKGRTLLM